MLSESSTALKVLIEPAAKGDAQLLYKVFSGTSSCQVDGEAVALNCTLLDLMGGDRYVVAAVACGEPDTCSEAVLGVGYTLPDRRFIFPLFPVFKSLFF